MYFYFRAFYLVKSRRQELIRAAEKARLLSHSRHSRRRRYHLRDVVLDKLGTVLIRWGEFLRSNYGTVIEQSLISEEH